MDFLNNIEIEVKAFFFNSKTDYLPYYKHFSFVIDKTDNETKLKELLAMIKEKNSDFSYPEKDLLFRVNKLVVTGEEKLSAIIDELGTELCIDPALSFRSDNGLILNNSDFMRQFKTIFKRHTENREDLEYYISLYPIHYASETFNYNHEYIGDAILVTAARIIKNNPDHKDEILRAINDEFNGISCCEYENNVFHGKDYSEIIAGLKKELYKQKDKSLMETLKAKCLNKMRKPIELESLEGKNIAIYHGDKHGDIQLEAFGGKVIDFEMSTKLAGQSIIESYPTIAHQKAGKMMLQAMDNGAEVLVCAKESDAKLFNTIVAEVENEMGREITLALISLSEFKAMANKVAA